MKLLVTGSTGLLGQAIVSSGRARNLTVIGLARSNADRNLDISDDARLTETIVADQPDIVINTAAVVSLDACDQDRDLAWRVNARAVQIMGEAAAACGARLIQISTDHYFTGDGDMAHDEEADVRILNEYARTKFAAERIASQWGTALTVRTNLVGFRAWKGRPTFVEWVLETLQDGRPVTMFEDVYTSSIDVPSFADALMDLIDVEASGVLNLASRDVYSKRTFIEALARRFGLSLENASAGSVRKLATPRGESLGLSMEKAEKLLGRRLPSLSDVVENLVSQAAEREIEYAV